MARIEKLIGSSQPEVPFGVEAEASPEEQEIRKETVLIGGKEVEICYALRRDKKGELVRSPGGSVIEDKISEVTIEGTYIEGGKKFRVVSFLENVVPPGANESKGARSRFFRIEEETEGKWKPLPEILEFKGPDGKMRRLRNEKRRWSGEAGTPHLAAEVREGNRWIPIEGEETVDENIEREIQGEDGEICRVMTYWKRFPNDAEFRKYMILLEKVDGEWKRVPTSETKIAEQQ